MKERYIAEPIVVAGMSAGAMALSTPMIYAGSKELYKYQQVTASQSGGLTADQIKPIYTNMKGTDVLGFVGSRAYRTFNNAGIEDITLDSMMVSPILSSLNIKGRTSD